MSAFISVQLEEGEMPESVTGGPGIAKSLASWFDDINELAANLGLRPLADFFYADEMDALEAIWQDESLSPEETEAAIAELGSGGPWFDPVEALGTIRGLIEHLESPVSRPDAEIREGWLVVLRSVADELDHARRQGTRFRLGYSE